MSSVRWNVAVSTETDQALRIFLASRGQGRKGDLSRFIEDAVRECMFRETAQAVKEQNREATTEEIEAAVSEALAWGRKA